MFSKLEDSYRGVLVWDENTIYLYIGIVFSCCIFASISQMMNKNRDIKIKSNFFFLLSFLVVCFFLVFRDVGADLPMYKNIYNNSDLGGDYFNGQEPGFLLLNRVLKYLNLSDSFVIGLFGFITVLLYYKSIQFFSRSINVGLAVFAFGCLYYLQSFSLIRIYLVSGIVLYASKYLVQFELKKYLIIILLTIFIHYSAVLILIPLALYWVYLKTKIYFYLSLCLIFVLGFAAINFLSSIPVFARYESYISGGVMKGGIGLMQIVINIPLFFLYYYGRHKIGNTTIMQILFVYSFSALLIGLLSYKVMMIGRSLIYYNFLFVICIPYVVRQLKIKKARYISMINVILYIYFFFRLYQYLGEYLYFDKIMPYKFIDI